MRKLNKIYKEQVMKKININKTKDGAWTDVILTVDGVIIKQFDGDPKLDVIALTKDDFMKLGKIAEMLKAEEVA